MCSPQPSQACVAGTSARRWLPSIRRTTHRRREVATPFRPGPSVRWVPGLHRSCPPGVDPRKSGKSFEQSRPRPLNLSHETRDQRLRAAQSGRKGRLVPVVTMGQDVGKSPGQASRPYFLRTFFSWHDRDSCVWKQLETICRITKQLKFCCGISPEVRPQWPDASDAVRPRFLRSSPAVGGRARGYSMQSRICREWRWTGSCWAREFCQSRTQRLPRSADASGLEPGSPGPLWIGPVFDERSLCEVTATRDFADPLFLIFGRQHDWKGPHANHSCSRRTY